MLAVLCLLDLMNPKLVQWPHQTQTFFKGFIVAFLLHDHTRDKALTTSGWEATSQNNLFHNASQCPHIY